MAIYGSYLDDLISVLPILLALSGAVLLLFWRIARRRPGAMTAAAVVYLSVLVSCFSSRTAARISITCCPAAVCIWPPCMGWAAPRGC